MTNGPSGQSTSDGPAPVHVIGGGLAGSEASWALARLGVPVVLHEMRPVRGTDAHQTEGLAELVCSNSFRSDDAEANAVGVLHAELRRCGSLIMAAGDQHQVPAGGALAVDRVEFSNTVQRTLEAHPLITIQREEVAGAPPADWDSVIVATGPLTSPQFLSRLTPLWWPWTRTQQSIWRKTVLSQQPLERLAILK